MSPDPEYPGKPTSSRKMLISGQVFCANATPGDSHL